MKTFIVVILLSITFSVSANESTSKLEHCKFISDVAGAILVGRYEGKSLYDLLALEGFPEEYHHIAVHTYERVIHSRSEYAADLRKQHIQDYKNRWFTQCYGKSL